MCEAGHVRHSGACKEPPACGDEEDECKVGDWAERADTLDPATNRWYCQAAGESESCPDLAPPPNCGANEEYALDALKELTCVCEAGYHLSGAKCVQNPMCSDPLVEKTCKVGKPVDYKNTAIPGVCKRTEAAKCKAGKFEDLPDTPKTDGKCDAKKDSCLSGMAANEDETTSTYTWDCLGIAGSRNWSCNGLAGAKEWNCENGDPKETQSCELPSVGSSRSCGEQITASDYQGCYSCRSGYEDINGVCKKKCGPNAMRDPNGNCVCKSGFVKIGGVCSAVVKLTVNPVPAKCHITAGPGVAVLGAKADGISCGHKGANCLEYYRKGRMVTLTKADKAGYECTWSGICRGAGTSRPVLAP